MTYVNYPLFLFMFFSFEYPSEIKHNSSCILLVFAPFFLVVQEICCKSPPPILGRNCYCCTFPTPLIYFFLYLHSISSMYTTKSPLTVQFTYSFVYVCVFFFLRWGKPSLQRNETQFSNSTSETL